MGEHAARIRRAAAQGGPDVGHEQCRAVGLGEIGVCPQIHGGDLVELGVQAGEHDDGDVARATQGTADHAAVATRDHGVHDHAVRRGSQDLPGHVFEARAHKPLEALEFQELAELLLEPLIVFDYEYLGHTRSSRRHIHSTAKGRCQSMPGTLRQHLRKLAQDGLHHAAAGEVGHEQVGTVDTRDDKSR